MKSFYLDVFKIGGSVEFLGLSIRNLLRESSLKGENGCSWLLLSAEFGFSGGTISNGKGEAGSHSFRVSLNANTFSLPITGSHVLTFTLEEGETNVKGLILVEWLDFGISSESNVVF